MINTLSIFLLSMPGGTELILIIAVVLLMFGGKKIPELMRGIGKGMRDFKDAKENVSAEIEKGMNAPVPERANMKDPILSKITQPA